MVVGLLAAVWSLAVPMAAEAAIKVKLVNRSSQKIWVAMTYKDLEGDWVNRGWWTVRPGSSMTPNIQTKNRIVYFYNQIGSDEAAHMDEEHQWKPEYYVENLTTVIKTINAPRLHVIGRS